MVSWTHDFMCVHCKRFYGGRGPGPLACTAFPDGIPDDILDNLADHRIPIEGDHGLRFDPMPGFDDSNWWWGPQGRDGGPLYPNFVPINRRDE